MSLNRMMLVTLLAFLLGSKVINEQYALVVFPFAFLEAWRVGGGWRWLARLLWIVPLAFAIMRTQIDRFFWLLYRNVWGPAAKAVAVTAKTGFSGQFIPDRTNSRSSFWYWRSGLPCSAWWRSSGRSAQASGYAVIWKRSRL
jgi:hypothetical protein